MHEATEMELRVLRAISEVQSGTVDEGLKITRAAIRALHGRGTVWPSGIVEAMKSAYIKNFGPHGISETLAACFNAAIDECSPPDGYVSMAKVISDARADAMRARFTVHDGPLAPEE